MGADVRQLLRFAPAALSHAARPMLDTVLANTGPNPTTLLAGKKALIMENLKIPSQTTTDRDGRLRCVR